MAQVQTVGGGDAKGKRVAWGADESSGLCRGRRKVKSSHRGTGPWVGGGGAQVLRAAGGLARVLLGSHHAATEMLVLSGLGFQGLSPGLWMVPSAQFPYSLPFVPICSVGEFKECASGLD